MTGPLSLVVICTAIVAAIIGGPWALVYIPVYVLVTLPGWPIGRALFGRHPGAWVTGALVGYGLTSVAFWAVLALDVPSAASFFLAWAIVTTSTWTLVRRRDALVVLSAWSARDARALILLLLLVPAVFVMPYKNLGARDAEGNQYYRAYFTADFIWHTALTAELMKYDMPPINPYLGDRSIQYYWTYFLVPAVVAQEGPSGLEDVELVLKANALLSGVLFVGALILATWSASRSTTGTVIAILLGVLAVSTEGVYMMWHLAVERGRSLTFLRYYNIDAISAWRFNGLRVDSLVRSMWYNPHHSMAAGLGLLAMPVAGAAGVEAPIGAIVVAGLALALCTTINPLIGGLFSLIYGGVILVDAFRARRLRPVFNHASAALLVGLAVAWCIGNEMVEGAENVVQYGFDGLARNSPIATLAISLGVILIPALLALWPPSKLLRPAWPSVAGLVTGLLVFYFVRISRDAAYMGFRGGQLLQVAMPGLAAVFFARLMSWNRAVCAGVAAILIAAGTPTTLIDTFNAQDIGNHYMGPGFKWTITLTREEQDAYRWLRTQTEPNAIVAMDPVAHGRETWSQLPTFAWRRVAAAKPISLMAVPDYELRTQLAHTMYADPSPERAARIARELGIAYVFIGPDEVRANPRQGIAKFDRRPDLFRPVFSNARTRVYEVGRP